MNIDLSELLKKLRKCEAKGATQVEQLTEFNKELHSLISKYTNLVPLFNT